MESKYNIAKRAYEITKGVAGAALVVYVIGGSAVNATKTGHPSADIATGISQPTALERMLMDLPKVEY